MRDGGSHVHEVALMLSPNTIKFLLEFRPVNERIITARLQAKHGSIPVMQCYAPTNNAILRTDFLEDEKDLLQFKD